MVLKEAKAEVEESVEAIEEALKALDSKKRKLGIGNREKRENKEKTKQKQFALIPYLSE